jgi:hypothetical protein
MLPAYALAVLLVLAALPGILAGRKAGNRYPRRRQARAVATSLLGLLLFAGAAALPALYAMPSLQEPLEPSVGSTQMRASDGMTMVCVPAGAFQTGSRGLLWLRRRAVSREGPAPTAPWTWPVTCGSGWQTGVARTIAPCRWVPLLAGPGRWPPRHQLDHPNRAARCIRRSGPGSWAHVGSHGEVPARGGG